MSKLKIAIDAGHGPDTPGKRSPDESLREFQFNNPTAKTVALFLANYEGVETSFTHAPDGSRDVPLKERTDKANAWGADVLISIHANASGDGWSSAEGIETFTYTKPSAASVQLAKALQTQLITATGLRDRGVKMANYHMVRESRMPAILVECGFMTHRREVELLKSEAYRQRCAEAIVSALVQVYDLQPIATNSPGQPSAGSGTINAPSPTAATGINQTSNKTEYSDIKPGSWYEDGIKRVTDPPNALMSGYPDGTFRPEQPVSRAELAVILANWLRKNH
ncbi:N-acetylmuramoyl-L-alanine amidase [Paenibacillus sp. SYP-B4298]|uniref:N-acetylmuramoyl-L-alanine amidase n=1 Tax=Paenibacillus sp. SYP-B4298 TaxID=2996034 RepID=UPI0022DDFEE2|nr:N-acetylmuramoyl-L-alanine amidase [Paenibacillus sp. SYP-B4298]